MSLDSFSSHDFAYVDFTVGQRKRWCWRCGTLMHESTSAGYKDSHYQPPGTSWSNAIPYTQLKPCAEIAGKKEKQS